MTRGTHGARRCTPAHHPPLAQVEPANLYIILGTVACVASILLLSLGKGGIKGGIGRGLLHMVRLRAPLTPAQAARH